MTHDLTDKGMAEIYDATIRDRCEPGCRWPQCGCEPSYDDNLASLTRIRDAAYEVDDTMVERALDAAYGPEWVNAPGPRVLRADMRIVLEAALSKPLEKENG